MAELIQKAEMPSEQEVLDMKAFVDGRFSDRQVFIQKELQSHESTDFTVYHTTVEIDEVKKTGKLVCDAGMIHQRKDQVERLGALGTSSIIIVDIGYDRAKELKLWATSVRTQVEDLAASQADMPAVHTFPNSGRTVLDQIRMLKERFEVKTPQALAEKVEQAAYMEALQKFVRDADSMRMVYPGLGGTAVGLENEVKESTIPWDPNNPNSHRITIIHDFMGKEGLRSKAHMGKYTLEEHGKNQAEHAKTETLRYITKIKRSTEASLFIKQPDEQLTKQLAPNINHILEEGHSMGGFICYASALNEARILERIKDEHLAVASDARMVYILNTPVTVGFDLDPKAVPLLLGKYGWLMRVGAKVYPEITMQIVARYTNIMKNAHEHNISHPDNMYQLVAHLAQIDLDPASVAQDVNALKQVESMNDLTEKFSDMRDRLVLEHRIAVVIAQNDSTLNSQKMAEFIIANRLPFFTLPMKEHYISNQSDTVIHALLYNDMHLIRKQIDFWLQATEIANDTLDTVVRRKLTEFYPNDIDVTSFDRAIEVAAKVVTELTGKKGNEKQYKNALKTLDMLISKSMRENGMVIYPIEEVLPLESTIESELGAVRQLRSQQLIKELLSYVAPLKASVPLFTQQFEIMRDAYKAHFLQPTASQPDIKMYDDLILERMNRLLDSDNIRTPHGFASLVEKTINTIEGKSHSVFSKQHFAHLKHKTLESLKKLMSVNQQDTIKINQNYESYVKIVTDFLQQIPLA